MKTGALAGSAAIVRGPLAEDPKEMDALRKAVIDRRGPTAVEQRLLAAEIAEVFVTARRIRKATDVLMASASRRAISDDESAFRAAARKQEIALSDASEFRTWLTSRDRDPLWGDDDRYWKSVHLYGDRAQRFVTLLREYHATPAWPPPATRWTDKPSMQTPQLWFLALRNMVVCMFDARSATLADWLDALIRALTTSVWSNDTVEEKLNLNGAATMASRQMEVLDHMTRVQARARVESRLAKLNEMYSAASGDESLDEV